MSKNERTLKSEFGYTLKEVGFLHYSFPDLPSSTANGFRFNPQKPFDAIAIKGNKTLGIEYKNCLKRKSVGLSQLRPNQIEELLKIKKETGFGFIIGFGELDDGIYAFVVDIEKAQQNGIIKFEDVEIKCKRYRDKEKKKYLFNIEGLLCFLKL